MDTTDRKLLDILQRDAALSLDDFSERVGLSRNACWRRIKRLEDEGVIKARVTLLDASRIKVEANGSEVILRGTVRSWAEREEAEQAAWRAPGVTKVDNRIRIEA